MVNQAPLVINPISQSQYAAQFLAEYPYPWNSSQAKAIGGVLNAVAAGVGNQDSFIQMGIVYAFNASRIQTATDTELDLCAQDFYGNGLPRAGGETDTSYRFRIMAGLLKPKVTLPAIAALLEGLTGVIPRMLEPWNINSTGAWDWETSGWDADSLDTPSRWGDPSQRYQGAIITPLPSITPAQSSGPIYGWDAGAGWDIFTGTWWTVSDTIFLNDDILDALIIGAAAFGVTIWRQFIVNVVPQISAVRILLPEGAINYPGTVSPAGPFALGASTSWVSTIADLKGTGTYNLIFGSPAPDGGAIEIVISQGSNNGAQTLGIPLNDTSYPLTFPTEFTGGMPIVCPSWQTSVWITDFSSSGCTLNFSNAAPGGASVDVQYVGSGQAFQFDIPNGAPSVVLAVPGSNNAVLVLPSYNTACGVVGTSNPVNVLLGTAAPDGSQKLFYAVVPIISN